MVGIYPPPEFLVAIIGALECVPPGVVVLVLCFAVLVLDDDFLMAATLVALDWRGPELYGVRLPSAIGGLICIAIRRWCWYGGATIHGVSFSRFQVSAMRARLRGMFSRRQHVEHCLHQLARFAHQAQGGRPFRAAQFGLNLGRAQELLGAPGGAATWWRPFEAHIEAAAWGNLKALACAYTALVGLPEAPAEFLERA